MGPQTTINDMACLYWQPSHANVSFRDIKAPRLSNKCNTILSIDAFFFFKYFSSFSKRKIWIWKHWVQKLLSLDTCTCFIIKGNNRKGGETQTFGCGIHTWDFCLTLYFQKYLCWTSITIPEPFFCGPAMLVNKRKVQVWFCRRTVCCPKYRQAQEQFWLDMGKLWVW